MDGMIWENGVPLGAPLGEPERPTTPLPSRMGSTHAVTAYGRHAGLDNPTSELAVSGTCLFAKEPLVNWV